MDNFKIQAYNDILELNNTTQKFIDTLPDEFLMNYFSKDDLKLYTNHNDNLAESSTIDIASIN
jgi:hypothetical protein